MKARVALLASLFSLCLVAVVAAQVSTVEGTVVSNSGGSLVISTDSGQRTFMVDAQSTLPANLAVGSRVRVDYHTLANDKFHAFKVSSLGSTTDMATANTTAPDATTPATTNSMDTTNPTNTNTRATTTTPDTTNNTTTDRVGTRATTTTERPTTSTTQTATTNTTTDRTTSTTDTTGRALPATASPLPLLALVGSLALGAGAALRLRRA